MKKVLIILLILSIPIIAYAAFTGAGVRFTRPLHPQVNTVGLIAHYKMWDGLMTVGEIFDYTCNGNGGSLQDTDATLIPTYPGFNFTPNDYISIDDHDDFTPAPFFEIESESGDTNNHQGVADNGTNLFTFDTQKIHKRNRTSPYAVVVSESLANIKTDAGGDLDNCNHFGDGCVYGNYIYIPLQRWVSCADNSDQYIVRLNKSDCTYSAHWDITAQGHEAAGICTDGTYLYIVSFCDGSKIWKYNIGSGTYVSSITLSSTLPQLQGITYNPTDGHFYVSEDGHDYIIKISTSGTIVETVYHYSNTIILEGLDFTQGRLIALIVVGPTGGKIEKITFFKLSPQPFSLSVWGYMHDATNFFVASKGVYNVDAEWLLGTEGTDRFYISIRDESVDDCYIGRQYTTVLTTYEDEWIHLVWTYDGGNTSAAFKLYLNGIRVDNANRQADAASFVAVENLNHDVWIGRYSTQYADGLIDDMMFFNKELTAIEVRNIYEVTRWRYSR